MDMLFSHSHVGLKELKLRGLYLHWPNSSYLILLHGNNSWARHRFLFGFMVPHLCVSSQCKTIDLFFGGWGLYSRNCIWSFTRCKQNLTCYWTFNLLSRYEEFLQEGKLLEVLVHACSLASYIYIYQEADLDVL